MLPLKDDVRTSTTPVVTVALVTANALAFLYQVSLGGAGGEARAAHEITMEFGLIPCRLTGLCASPPGFPSATLTLFTSALLHAGFFHVGANLLYLWIFGSTVEDTLGHGRFLLFYLGSGAAAGLAQVAVEPGSPVPMIGASGAVSGVLGAYLLLFPHARVLTVVAFGFFVRVVRVPALLVLGLWLVVQLVNGLLMAGGEGSLGGVAWFAHIGGFVAGMGLLLALRRSVRRS